MKIGSHHTVQFLSQSQTNPLLRFVFRGSGEHRWAVLPVDVQNTDEGVLFGGGVQGLVDVLHDPVKHVGVDVFGERVTGIGGLQPRDGLDVGLLGCLQLLVAQPMRHVLVGHAHQLTKHRQVAVIGLRERDSWSCQSFAQFVFLLFFPST